MHIDIKKLSEQAELEVTEQEAIAIEKCFQEWEVLADKIYKLADNLDTEAEKHNIYLPLEKTRSDDLVPYDQVKNLEIRVPKLIERE